MKESSPLPILFAVLLMACNGFAAFTVTTEVDGTVDWSSYDSPQFSPPSYILGGAYFSTYFYCMYPQYTNHIYTVGHSGANWETVYETDEERTHILLWSTFAVPGNNWIMANDNGGYSSNSVYQWGTNIFAFPSLSWNGSAVTNQGITIAGITHYAMGCLPDVTAPPSSLAFLRNNATTNLNVLESVPIIDTYGYLWTNGISTNAQVYAGGHPFPDYSLIIANYHLHALGVETNVGALTLNWGAASASTNHCVASSISVVGSALTATVHWDRMPMAWDVPDGTITNDCRNAVNLDTSFGNSFQWTVQVTNLPVGTYTVAIDGSNVVTLSSSQLAAGWNMFTNYNGALWAQRKAVLAAKRDQEGVDHVSNIAHSAGSTGVIPGVGDMINLGGNGSQEYVTNGKRGTTYLTAMATWVSQVKQYDLAIHNAAMQTNHTFSFTLNAPRYLPFHR